MVATSQPTVAMCFRAIVAVGIAAFSSSSSSLATMCDTSVTISMQEHVDLHDLVFAGRVEEVTLLDLPALHMPAGWSITTSVVRFSVSRAWKGVAGSEVLLFSGNPGEKSSSFFFEKGRTYLVFARPDPLFLDAPYVAASACSPTGLLDEAARHVKKLDRLFKKRDRRDG